ncbi:MAG: shikimate dehydrogenase [Gammaproteobacteria bacterium]|nr:MAG: shikimate dehydrogenase [Gammaproteobacteria bacterium]
MSDHYAVIGNPVAHSKSPQIHAAFAKQTGEDVHYDTLLAPLDDFSASIDEFFHHGGKGLNVTVPFKRQAFELAAILTERASHAAAVNTLWMGDDNELKGDNTDGVGLVNDLLNNLKTTLMDRRILLLGAGGAVRGVINPLLATQPESLVIANRTASRAEELALASNQWQEAGICVSGCGLDDLEGRQFDIIINGTAASLEGKLPRLPDSVLIKGGVCYDMMYSAEPTVFVQWGENHAAGTSVDGFGMLVEQAAESFYIWRGVRPRTGPVLKELRQQIRRLQE